MFNRNWIYYIIGVVVIVGVYSWDKVGLLLLFVGGMMGYLLHGYVRGIYDDWNEAYFNNEKRRRDIRKKVLEQELEQLKQGD